MELALGFVKGFQAAGKVECFRQPFEKGLGGWTVGVPNSQLKTTPEGFYALGLP